MIPTQDHDQGPAPLYSGPVGALAVICIDGHRWAMMPPGDPLSDRLAADYIPTKKPAAVVIRSGLYLVSTALPLTPGKDRSNGFLHPHGARVQR